MVEWKGNNMYLVTEKYKLKEESTDGPLKNKK